MEHFDLLVFIGRFAPFHNGHLSILRKAAELSDNVLILVGSAGVPPSIRHPFSFEERDKFIGEAIIECLPTQTEKFKIRPIFDIPYNNSLWVKQIQEIVKNTHPNAKKIGLIGYNKDHTSFYLKLFPMWESVSAEGFFSKEHHLINSTNIRNTMFAFPGADWFNLDLTAVMPRSVQHAMGYFMNTVTFNNLVYEYKHIQEYKKSWEAAPYPPIFVTVDAVCVQAGHVLLVKRRAAPGRGLLAMPGGFVEQTERLEDAVLRELKEETNLDIPPAVLKNKIKASRVFDNPHRSERGRTITHAFLFDLNDEVGRKTENWGDRNKDKNKPFTSALGLSKVKGGDDAVKAFWHPIAELDRSKMFEDHYDVISEMLEEM